MNNGKWLGKYSHGASSLKPPSIPVEPQEKPSYFPRITDCYINRDPGSLEWFMKYSNPLMTGQYNLLYCSVRCMTSPHARKHRKHPLETIRFDETKIRKNPQALVAAEKLKQNLGISCFWDDFFTDWDPMG